VWESKRRNFVDDLVMFWMFGGQLLVVVVVVVGASGVEARRQRDVQFGLFRLAAEGRRNPCWGRGAQTRTGSPTIADVESLFPNPITFQEHRERTGDDRSIHPAQSTG